MDSLSSKWRSHFPGFRTLKTALTVLLCVLLGQLGSMSSPFFMTLAGIITIQVSTADSFRMGRTRILGTAVGALVGLLFALIQPENAFLAGIGVIVVIQICDRLHWNAAIQIATVVFMAIMVNLDGKDPLFYSLSRLLDTSLGVLIALTINYFVYPYNNLKQIIQGFESLEIEIAKSLEPVLSEPILMTQVPQPIGDIEPTREKILWIRDQIKLYDQEVQIKKEKQGEIEPYKIKFELFWDVFEHTKHLIMLTKEMEDQTETNTLEFRELMIVYQYHLKRVNQSLMAIQ